MAKPHRRYLPEQNLLLPPSLQDWLPAKQLADFASDLIAELNLSSNARFYE